jgi:hypothetical protein
MRRAALVLSVFASTASAETRSPEAIVGHALSSRSALAAAFAEDVQLGAVPFLDDACAKRFSPGRVRPADRRALAACVLALAPTLPVNGFVPSFDEHVTTLAHHDALLAFEVRGGRIASIGAVATDANDAALPTFVDIAPFEGSRALRAAAIKRDHVIVAIKLCTDVAGKVTSRRIVHASGLQAFDDQIAAQLAKFQQFGPLNVRDTPVAACVVVVSGIGHDDRFDAPPPPPPPSAAP